MTVTTFYRFLSRAWPAVVALLPLAAHAIDPPTCKARLTLDGQVHELKHAFAYQPAGKPDELWVFLGNREIMLAQAQDPSKLTEAVTRDGFVGLKLVINPRKPDPKRVEGRLFRRAADGSAAGPAFLVMRGAPSWQRIQIGDKRVAGHLKHETVDSGNVSWSLEAEFSAPVFGAVKK